MISNDAEFKSISDAVKNFGQELIDAPKTFESGLVVPERQRSSDHVHASAHCG